MRTSNLRLGFQAPGNFWSQHREASLNWLALGLLLAAWNVADNDTGDASRGAAALQGSEPRRKPEMLVRPAALRGYSYVSVRAAKGLSATRSAQHPNFPLQ
jgi:hypothetical protein